jgi:hypothetical protein
MDVREAARRTLAAGTARVCVRRFFDPPQTHPLVAVMEMTTDGVVDLTRRRARLEQLDHEGADALAERLLSRWPWLDDEEGEDDEEIPFVTVFIGGRRYSGYGLRWVLMDEGGPAVPPENPIWILDALAGAGTARPLGVEEVRGERCERYALERVDMRTAFETANGAIALPPHGKIERPTLRGDVWVDGEGRVRRVTWIQRPRGRPRLRPSKTSPRLWQSTELWDFGLPVTIDVPDAVPPADEPPLLSTLWEIGTALWHMRTDYRRRHPEAG